MVFATGPQLASNGAQNSASYITTSLTGAQLQAIGLDGSKVPVAQAMQAVSKPGARGEPGGASFVAGSILNIVQRSRYGKKAPQNMTRDVRQARNLAESASGLN